MLQNEPPVTKFRSDTVEKDLSEVEIQGFCNFDELVMDEVRANLHSEANC